MTIIHHPRTCLSAGHGLSSRMDGKIDTGADVIKTDGREENTYVLNMAKSVEHELRILYGKLGRVFVRDQGKFYLADDFAVDNACDLFIEFHLNSGGGTGTEVLFNDGADKAKAKKLSADTAKALHLRDRGAKRRTDLAVLKPHSGMVQLLWEGWFADNIGDKSAHNLHRDAEVLAIVNFILYHNGWKQVKVLPSKMTKWQKSHYKPY